MEVGVAVGVGVGVEVGVAVGVGVVLIQLMKLPVTYWILFIGLVESIDDIIIESTAFEVEISLPYGI